MKKFLGLLCLSLIFIPSNVLSQCIGPYCTPPAYSQPYFPPSYNPGTPSDYQIGPFEVDERVLDKIKRASVIVYSREYNMRSVGSGTLAKLGDSVIVLTASHVVSNPRATYIICSEIGEVPCIVHRLNQIVDYAILEPQQHQEQLYEMAVEIYGGANLDSETELIAAGYGGRREVFLWCTKFITYTTPQGWRAADWMELHIAARQGDSGGGIFTKDGKIVGIIWGAWKRYTMTDIQFIDTLKREGLSTSIADLSVRLRSVRSRIRSGTFAVWIGGLSKDLIELKCIWRRPRRPNLQPPVVPEIKPPMEPVPKPDKPIPKQETPKTPIPDQTPFPVEEQGDQFSWFEFFRPTILVLIGWVAFLVSFVVTNLTGHYLKE